MLNRLDQSAALAIGLLLPGVAAQRSVIRAELVGSNDGMSWSIMSALILSAQSSPAGWQPHRAPGPGFSEDRTCASHSQRSWAVEATNEGIRTSLVPRRAKPNFRSGKYQGVMGRTRFVAAELGINLAGASRPYRTVAELSAWRNDLVHPQSTRHRGTTSARVYAQRVIEPGPAVFAKRKPAFAKRCFEDAADLAQLLLEAAITAGRDELSHLGNTALWGPLTIGQGSLTN